jgi:site-specific DNA recombinase
VGQPRKHGRGKLQYPRPEARPAAEWITLTVPAIVMPDLWEQAQEHLALNARNAARNTQHSYLLRGLLVCDVCGRTLQGRTQGTTVTYGCTHGGKDRPPGVPQHTCTVRASEVESRVWQTLRELLQAPEQIREAWQALQDDGNSPPEQALRDRQQALEQQVHRLVVAYQEGAITLAELKTQRAPLDAEIQRLTEQLGRAQQQTARLPDLTTFTKLIERALEAADFETQQKVIRLLIDHIVVADDAITVTHIVPTIDSRLDHTCRDS